MTLIELGERVGTDKGSRHSYLDIYEKLFEPLRDKPITLLELGIHRGASLAMWKEWFYDATLFGLDNDAEAVVYGLPFGTCIWGNQDDRQLLETVFEKEQFDIIIDDAGHEPQKQILSHAILWPMIKPGGYYIIEDTPNDQWADAWNIDGATVYRNHKNGVEDDILVVIKK